MRRRKRKRIRMFIKAICCIIILVFAGRWLLNSVGVFFRTSTAKDELDLGSAEEGEFSLLSSQFVNAGEEAGLVKDTQLSHLEHAASQMYSNYMLLVDRENGQALYQADADKKIYPASLTKLMTALIAIEYIEDIDVYIELNVESVQDQYRDDLSMAGFSPGDSVRAIDLLYGLILRSGADAAIGLAEYTAGSEEEFVKLMNHKAEALGMKDTHFVNVTGKHDKKHYSTLQDLYRLMDYALANPLFKEIFQSDTHIVTQTYYNAEPIYMESTLSEKYNNTDEEILNGHFIGGKTGTTSEAGLCLISMANVNGHEYMLLTADAPYQEMTDIYNIIDAIRIYSSLNE